MRLADGEAPLPGITPPNPLVLPDPLVDRLWHISFNQLKETNEELSYLWRGSAATIG